MSRKIMKKERLCGKPYISLNLKFTLTVILAVAISLLAIKVANIIENEVADKEYKNPKAIEKNVGGVYRDLEDFIKTDNVSGTDAEMLQKWIQKYDYTYIYVYDNYNSTFDGGWQVNSDSKMTSDVVVKGKTPDEQRKNIERGGVKEEEPKDDSKRITPEYFTEDVQNRIVDFADGPYYVYVDVYKQQQWRSIMFIVKVILCAAIFFAIMLIYNGRLKKRIKRLSDDVKHISEGELYKEITPVTNDEIGQLTASVDIMRSSILEKLQNEKEAWDANTQLITAMSHDIRTPLTSMIGYLDIIEGHKYNGEEELMKYIGSCRDKAFQLKDLSDKLFQYFLVFGSHEGDRNPEIFDAGILLQQIIYEHTAELINYGYIVDFDFAIPEVEIEADLLAMQRLFDNVFSNILKYGDKEYHVSISAFFENGRIVIRLLNSILESSKKVESNKIGLKTCEKICLDMGGTFVSQDKGQLFSVRISLPEYVKPEGLQTEEENS